MQTTLAPAYNLLFEIDYTAQEAELAEKLRNHIANVEKNDVRDFREAVMMLFNSADYMIGCGGNHIWVARRSNPNDRLLFIGSTDVCAANAESLEIINRTPQCLPISA